MCGERGGLILEKPFKLGDSLNGVTGLDIDTEQHVVSHTLDELHHQGASEDEIKAAMKDLGITRFV